MTENLIKLKRTENAKRNIIFGGLLKVYQIIVPFFIRTAMIYYIGMEYVGLNSLFISILQVLNLAELGVGSAMIFSMYQPIAEKDEETICALMQLYKRYYRVIGMIILFLGVLLMPALPILIKGSIPDGLNLNILYLLNLGATVLSYWLFAYKNCLLVAHQRTDITSKVGIGISTIEYVLQFISIAVYKNYYLYLIIRIVAQIIQNIIMYFVVENRYPHYHPSGSLEGESVKKINHKIKDLFTAKIGAIVFNSVDSIVISAFLGLSMLAVYNNYYYILSSIIGFVAIIFNSCIAGIGNSIVTETAEKNYRDFCTFTFIISWLSGVCVCCLTSLYQPFMFLWLKNKEMMLGMSEVVCYSSYFFVYELAAMMIQYKDAAGIWHKDRFRPLVTAIANLTMNVVFVQFIGIKGVLISTIISFLIIGIPWLVHNLFAQLFHCQPYQYLKRVFTYVIVTIFVTLFGYYLCYLLPFDGWGGFIVRAIICLVISNLIYLLIYRNMDEFLDAKKIVRQFVVKIR